MLTVYKYPIKLKEKQDLILPLHAEFLSATMQGDQIVLYFKVISDPIQHTRETIHIVGTGHEVPTQLGRRYTDGSYERKLFFLATVPDSGYVWHIFIERGGGIRIVEHETSVPDGEEL